MVSRSSHPQSVYRTPAAPSPAVSAVRAVSLGAVSYTHLTLPTNREV